MRIAAPNLPFPIWKLLCRKGRTGGESGGSEIKKWDTKKAGKDWSEEEEKMLRAFTCSSCGAEIVCDENTIATECCYCGNPTMISQRYSGSLRPDYVIPFQKMKEDAQAAFKNFYKGKILLPGSFVTGKQD
ncbi:MAG: hypothetical protein ACLR1D_04260 [Dialister sp.]